MTTTSKKSTGSRRGRKSASRISRKPKLWIELWKNYLGEWRWRARVTNTRILADSGGGYRRRVDLMKALDTLFGGRVPEVVDLTRVPE